MANTISKSLRWFAAVRFLAHARLSLHTVFGTETHRSYSKGASIHRAFGFASMTSTEFSGIRLSSAIGNTAAIATFMKRTSPRVGLDRLKTSFEEARFVHDVGKFEMSFTLLVESNVEEPQMAFLVCVKDTNLRVGGCNTRSRSPGTCRAHEKEIHRQLFLRQERQSDTKTWTLHGNNTTINAVFQSDSVHLCTSWALAEPGNFGCLAPTMELL
ncbi:hypothetical protein AC1031_007969 [Aphanomyces cochlioides]|nr:hypothetical protein AC1031_007969 [Aphanomyces cochlioides]